MSVVRLELLFFLYFLTGIFLPLACSLVFPEETPETQFSNIRTNAVDIFRHYIVFNLSHQRYSKLLPLLDRLGKLYQAFDMQSAMCKCMMATTLVQLHMGDIVEV